MLMIAAGGLISFSAMGNTNTTTQTVNTPNPRKPGTDKSMRRMRSSLFTVNVLHFNKKIREKHDREVKALAMASNKKSGKEKRADRKSKRLALQNIGI